MSRCNESATSSSSLRGQKLSRRTLLISFSLIPCAIGLASHCSRNKRQRRCRESDRGGSTGRVPDGSTTTFEVTGDRDYETTTTVAVGLNLVPVYGIPGRPRSSVYLQSREFDIKETRVIMLLGRDSGGRRTETTVTNALPPASAVAFPMAHPPTQTL